MTSATDDVRFADNQLLLAERDFEMQRKRSHRQRGPGRGVNRTTWARLLVIGLIAVGIWTLRSLTKQTDAPVPRPREVHADFVRTDRAAEGNVDRTNGQSLREMLAAYQNLSTFREQSRIHVLLADAGRTQEDVIEMGLTYAAPNRIHYFIRRPGHEITVASNGTQLRARIQDPVARDFDGQFVERPAPRAINVATLFSATEYADPTRPQELLSALLGMPVDLAVSAVGIITDAAALQLMLDQATEIARMADETVSGHPCEAVRVTGPAGEYTFWIDQQSHLLRRLKHPATRLVADEGLRADLPTVTIISEHFPDDDFSIDASEFELVPAVDAKIVRHFVLPPRDQDVGLLNRQVPPFSFTDLQSEPFASARWEGRHAVLIWFNDHPACRELMTSLQPVFEKYQHDERLFFCAICTEPSTAMGHLSVRNLASAWGIPIKVVRDLDAVGRDVFAVQQAPTLIVTSPHPATNRDTVQLVEVGSHPDLGEQLPVVLEKLLGGDDVAGNFVAFVEKRQRDYERYLAAASAAVPTMDLDAGQTEIAAASQPLHFELTRLWQLRELAAPGNVLITRDARGKPRLLVHEGWSEIVAVSDDGRITERHELGEDVAVSGLRRQSGADGSECYVAMSSLGKQCHVFDAQWRHLLQYPPASTASPGIEDALLADLDTDGELELYVGFAGAGGVVRINLNGQRMWSLRQSDSVLSLTAVETDGGPRLLVTTAAGSLVPIDAAGRQGQPFSIGSRVIHHLYAGIARAAEPPWYCGLTYNLNGQLSVIGLDDRLQERWTYPLPAGRYDSQVRIVTAAELLPDGGWQWLLAGPDGSIHIVAPDGTFHDHFNTGSAVRGVAGFHVSDAHVLLIATDGILSAWRVTAK